MLFFRWHLLLRNAKIFIPVKDSFLIFTSGFALTIIPGKVGELVKSQLLKTKFGIARSKTVPIVILEQFYTAIGKRVLSNEIQDTYAPDLIPVYSANVLKPFGYINQEFFEDYNLASVLWGIDGDWMVNYLPAHQPFFPTDHCGVIRAHTDQVNPKYLAKLLDKAGEAERFSRHHRASTERVSNLTLSFPDIDIQNQVCKEIEQMESKIAKYQAIIDASVDKKHTIIESYL